MGIFYPSLSVLRSALGPACMVCGSPEGCAYSMHGAAIYACTLHGVTAASCTVELVGVLGARGCVTSVRSYSDPPIQLGKSSE